MLLSSARPIVNGCLIGNTDPRKAPESAISLGSIALDISHGLRGLHGFLIRAIRAILPGYVQMNATESLQSVYPALVIARAWNIYVAPGVRPWRVTGVFTLVTSWFVHVPGGVPPL